MKGDLEMKNKNFYRNHEKAIMLAIAIAIIIVSWVLFGGIMLGLNVLAADTSDGTTVNGEKIQYSNSQKKAIKDADMILKSDDNELVVALDDNSCKVTLKGQNSKEELTQTVKEKDNKLIIDANMFEDGETVLITFDFNANSISARIDRFFGKGGEEKKYWAFITSSESKDDEEAEPNSEAKSEPEDNDSVSEPGAIFINGIQLKSFDKLEEALSKNNISSLSQKVLSSVELSAEVSDDIGAVTVDVRNDANEYQYKEYILSSESKWTKNMSLQDVNGTTVILTVSYQTKGFLPDFTYRYIAIKVPSTSEEASSDEAQPAEAQNTTGQKQTSIASDAIYLNNFQFDVWNNFEDASSHSISLANRENKIGVFVEAPKGIAQISVDIKNTDGNQYESYILNEECNWYTEIDVQKVDKNAAVLVLGYQAEGLEPKVDYKYVVLSLPDAE